MTEHTQEQLNEIWENISTGRYGGDARIIKAQAIGAEAGTDIMSIPNSDGTAKKLYERKSQGTWLEVPTLGQASGRA